MHHSRSGATLAVEMPVYDFEAATQSGGVEAGTLTADSPRHARDILRSQGLGIVRVSPASSPRKSGIRRARGFRGRDLASVSRDLATLVESGVPLLNAMDAVVEQHSGVMGRSLLRLRDAVASGDSLSEAMKHDPAFPPVVVQMVRVGESTGRLGETLGQLAEFLDQSGRLKDRLLNSLAYPAFVLTAAACVSVFLLTVIVPTLLDGLLEAGRPIPLPTRVLKFLSDSLLAYGWAVALFAAAAVGSAVAYLRTHHGRRAFQTALLRVPLIGELSRKQAVSRASVMTGHLMAAGMDFVPAVEITAESLDHLPLRDALLAGVRDIRAGEGITPALRRTGMFSPVALQVFSVGQESGKLDEMLIRLGESYDKQVVSLSERLASLVEPALILVLSVVVGFIIFATVLPILEAGRVL